MKIEGHVAGGYLVSKVLTKRFNISESERKRLIILGTLGGGLPDMDSFIHLIQTRSFAFGSDFQHHKWITHTFAFYIVLGTIFYLYGQLNRKPELARSAIVITVGACVHLLQDMVGSGDGIMWAWPFSQRMDGVFLMGLHGREWAAAYSQHPIAWVERITVILAIITLVLDTYRYIRRN